MKNIKNCSLCANGLPNSLNLDILCKIKGVVSPDFVCHKYKALPMPRKILTMQNKCFGCEFYVVDAANSSVPGSLGFCQLFTVRKFNGQVKNACSRFTPKSQSEVS